MMQTMYDRFIRRQFEESFHQNVVLLWQALYYQSLLRETNSFEWLNQDACQLSGLSKDAFFRARRQLITHGFLHVTSQPGSSLVVYTLLSADHAMEEPKVKDAVSLERKAQLNQKRQEAQILATKRKLKRKAKGKTSQKMQVHAQVQPVDEPQADPQLELKIADSRSKSLKNLKKNLVKSQRTPTTNARCFDEISEYFDLSKPNEMMKTWLTEWFKRNGTAGINLLIQALEETKEAERPSWRYTKTLLFNWEKSGFHSLEDVIASDDARLEKQFDAKKRPKQANKKRSVNHERATRSIREEYPSADSDENEVRRFLCEGCEQEVIVYKMMLFFGTEKGKMKEMNRGCKCEDLRLGREARQAQIKMKQKRQMKWFEQFSLVNVDLIDARFDNYQPTTDKQEEAHSLCQSYVNEFTKTSGNLILSGPVTGIGKSHLSYSIVEALSNKGYKTLFLSVPKLLAAIRATYKQSSEQSEYDIIQRLVDVDCLCMDDLGAEYSKKDADGWVASKLFEIVDARLGKPTIYTTNLSADELFDRVGRRNFSRILYKTTSIKMDGRDYREWVKAQDK